MKKNHIPNINQRRILILTLIFSATIVGYISSCKKIDLTRIAVITTEPVGNVTATSATANGNIIDLGNSIIEHGFCWTTSGSPTINDYIASAGGTSSTGDFNLTISNLQQNTGYSIKSFIVDDNGVTYGNTEYFTTLQDIINDWLHYDDGINNDGIGYSAGGEFDVAIRFPKEDIQQHAGSHITKVKFFPREDLPTQYYVTIWEGDNPPELIFVELVNNPNIDGWTEHTLSVPYEINMSTDLWVGYWIVDYPPDTYPAGVDDGPAVAGKGDMISNDDGETWNAMSLIDPPSLNYNWNLQAYMQNTKGITTMLTNSSSSLQKKKENNLFRQGVMIPLSENENKN